MQPSSKVPYERLAAPLKPREPPAKRSTNLTYRILEELGVAIVTGQYNEENPFPVEAQLCSQLHVSRSILREAVKMLTAKGLLSARPRQGTWVQPVENWNSLDPDVLRWLLERKLSQKLLMEFNEMRLAVEPIAARLAATKASPETIAEIFSRVERMRAAESGREDAMTTDIAFHVSVMQASGNRFYCQLCDLIDTALRFSIRTTNAYKGVEKASTDDHMAVAEAIANHKPDVAEAAMRMMMQEAIDLIRENEKVNKT